jgi:voltage-gated potassium channel Kch
MILSASHLFQKQTEGPDFSPTGRKPKRRSAMLIRVLMPGVLLSLCIVIHALVMTFILRRLSRPSGRKALKSWGALRLLIVVALWIVSAHLVEIAVWASFMTWQRVFADFRTSFYFSAVTYTTVGYGDLVLPDPWRMLAAAEALTGILMCGWSTGLFFAVASRLHFALKGDATGFEGISRR